MVEVNEAGSIPTPPLRWDSTAWQHSDASVSHGLATAVTVAVFGVVFYLVLHRFLKRNKLTPAYVVAFAASAIFFGAAAAADTETFLTPLYGPAIWLQRLYAAAMLFVFLRVIDRLIFIPILSRGGRVPVQRFVQQIGNTVLVTFAVLAYGSWAFDWDIDRFLAGSAVVSIVLGLALQETLGNFFSGLVMQGSSPFALGDWIVCAGVEGKVVDMTWRAVTLQTTDDNYVLIPNSVIAKEQIVNFNSPTVTTVRTVTISLEYETAPFAATAVLEAAARETAGVLKEPAPEAFLADFAEGAVVYHLRFWIGEPARHLRIEHEVRSHAWYRLKQAGMGQLQTTDHVDMLRKAKLDAPKVLAERLEIIDRLPLFVPLSAGQKRVIAENSEDVLLGRGLCLIEQGAAGDSFYVIAGGQADVLVRQPAGGDLKVATLGAGDFVGEMSALTGQPRSATVRAASDLRCVKVGKEDFALVFEADPTAMEKISALVSRRNAEREAALAGAPAAAPQALEQACHTLMGRMMKWFGK